MEAIDLSNEVSGYALSTRGRGIILSTIGILLSKIFKILLIPFLFLIITLLSRQGYDRTGDR